jgi:mono/diheme cytochrome c family protein
MRCVTLRCSLVAASLVMPILALAQPLDGNASSGRLVAITSCVPCHQAVPTIPSGKQAAASFEDIANAPSITALSLNAFLHSNHNKMPNFILSHAEMDDVIAYILSLKRR